jgi:hypothetical protein
LESRYRPRREQAACLLGEDSMRRNIVVHSIVLFFVISASACCTPVRAANSDKMYVLGSALTKLSASVESTVRYKNPPQEISDAELLTLSTKHDPGLMEPFTDYTVRVSRQDRHVERLVCWRTLDAVPKWTGISGRRIRRSHANSP